MSLPEPLDAQFLFAFEILIETGFGNTGLRNDLVDPDTGIPSLLKKIPRRLQNLIVYAFHENKQTGLSC